MWLLTTHKNPTQLLVHYTNTDGTGLKRVGDIYPWASKVYGFPIALGVGSGATPNLYFMNEYCRIGIMLPGKEITTLAADIRSEQCGKATQLVVTHTNGTDPKVPVEDVLTINAFGTDVRNYGQLLITVRVDSASGRVIRSGGSSLPGTRSDYNRPDMRYTQLAMSASGVAVMAAIGVAGQQTTNYNIVPNF